MLKLKKSLGQNFLIDKNIIKKIISQENLKDKNVYEIGPGSGNLTNNILIEKPRHLTLIEKDERFCELLKNKFVNIKNINLHNSDILKYNLNNINQKDIIIFGNLPYNISTQILVNFINVKNWPPFFKKIIFMFQKEVADRIIAQPNSKQYGRLSILTNYRLDITNCFKISKNSFFPKPAVDSKVIVFKPKNKLNYNILNLKNLEKISNLFFSGKRKMINKPFKKIFKNYKSIAEKLQIDLSLRPSQLSFEKYYRIVEFYEKLK